MAPFATMILAVPALLLEGAGVLEWFRTTPNLLSSLVIIFGSGVMAFCLNFSIFYVIHSTTAVTFNVAGNLKVSPIYANYISPECIIFKNCCQFANRMCLQKCIRMPLYMCVCTNIIPIHPYFNDSLRFFRFLSCLKH